MKQLFSLLLFLNTYFLFAQNQYHILNGNQVFNQTSYEKFKDNISTKGKLTEKIALVFKKNDSTFALPNLKVELADHTTRYYFNNQVYFEQIFKKKVNFIGLEEVRNNKSINKSKPYFINCWYTNCKPCVEEIPDLNKLQEEYKDKVNFIAVTFDQETIVKRFLEKTSFNFVHLSNQHPLLNLMEIPFYPTSFILDKDGNFISFVSYNNPEGQMYAKKILDKLNPK
ncbi:TlpA family protein disulfide reductase [Chryseobacterium taiwanense]|uniref:TlpA family protein disulfide reductase n=1 Tax=Chryseobacterium taiwanense TaxID=363331 RepID=UPI00068D3F82|nr:TlpA disulfide reductase family protein [Chryseobacterium taiwanense]